MAFSFLFQNVGLPKWSSTIIRNQDVHTNGPVLDDVLLADQEVTLFFFEVTVGLMLACLAK